MAIIDTINNISSNLREAYRKLEEKGANIPEHKNMQSLPATIESIKGGSSTVRPNYVMFAFNPYESLDLSWLDVSNQESMSYMFSYSSLLKTLDLTNFNTSNATDMSYMFSDCNSLQTITFGNQFNTRNVTNMYNMFTRCSSLTSLDLSNFDTSSVTNMNGIFYGCSSLTNLNLSNFYTSNVTDMSVMFGECSSLTSITFSPSFDTSNVTDMYQMFYGCSSLKELDLSNFDLTNCTNAGRLFEDCTSLTTINSPLNLSIDCALPSIKGKEWIDTNDNDKVITTLPKGLSVNHTITIRNAVVASVEFPSDWKDRFKKVGVDFKSIRQLALDSDISRLEKYLKLAGTIGNGINVYTFIPDPPNVVIATKNSMYLTDKASSLFSDCVNVRNIQILNLDTSRTTNMQQMFSGNSNLSQIDLRTFDFTNVKDFDGMFDGVDLGCTIYVKDETAKTWINTNFSTLTNVVVK